MAIAASIFWLAISATLETITGSLAGGTNTRFALPTAARSLSCRSMSGCASLWANISASTMTSSLTSAHPPSTITIASRLAATIRSRSDVSRSAKVGLITNLPSMRPTRTPA